MGKHRLCSPTETYCNIETPRTVTFRNVRDVNANIGTGGNAQQTAQMSGKEKNLFSSDVMAQAFSEKCFHYERVPFCFSFFIMPISCLQYGL